MRDESYRLRLVMLLAQDRTYGEIAEDLGVSPKTVARHAKKVGPLADPGDPVRPHAGRVDQSTAGDAA